MSTGKPRGRPRKEVITPIIPEVADIRQDSWSNFFVGLGQIQDKSIHTAYGSANVIDDTTLSQLYLGAGLPSRIVDIVADDETREWIWLDGETGESILQALHKLDAEEAFNSALKWQRLYGGSIILMGINDGQAFDKPVNPTKIKSVDYLKPLDRTCVSIGESIFDINPLSPTFGKILQYHIRYTLANQQVEMKVHHSRVLAFHNDPVPVHLHSYVLWDTRYWGMSSLQKINEAIRDLGGITQSTVNILYEFVTGKFKFKNLAQMLAKGGEDKLVKRLQAINTSKSIINAIVLDQEEDYSRDYATLAGLPEVIDRFMLQLSGATGIPVTRLYGRSPAGLNATGESDLRNYYDLIEAQQRNRLQPPLRKLIDFIGVWLGIDTAKMKIEFNSLYQLSEEEKSKIAKTDAETAKIKWETEILLIDAGLKDVETVAMENGMIAPEVEEDFEDEDENAE